MVNRAACAMLGSSEGELLTLGPQDIYDEESGSAIFAGMERQTREENSPIPDVRMQRRNGGEFYGDLNAVTVMINGRCAMMSCLHDVTERRRAQLELRNMEAQLRQQQRLESIGTLASGVAHEINNPLMSIMNFAELIQTHELPPEKAREFAGKIVAESVRAAKIVGNLLAFSRQDSEENSPEQIENVIQSTMSLIETTLKKDGITVTVAVEKGLPAFRCRSQQIQQVLLNLITNARAALNERHQGKDPEKTLSICSERLEKDGRPWIRTIVEDRGVGIDPKTMPRIFDPFFSTKPRHVGTGLGLSVSHGIVREHNGELWVESALGEFSRFYMDLPVDDGRRPGGRGSA
jgi:PAS domain S-box-containing protein